MINWPESLVRELGRRRVFLFLGAGVSSSACDSDGNTPQGWGEFLETASNLIEDQQQHAEIQNLLANKKYPLALQAIKDLADPAGYSSLMNKSFNNGRFKASDLHEIIFDLDVEIIITTNFDKIYEGYCHQNSDDGYSIQTYQSSGLGDLIRSDTRLIIKAHGCVNEISSMIFTRAEYHDAKKNYPRFYELLKAIFLTHTCIFIGCGMDDPDILLTLEEVNIVSSSTFPHYMCAKEGSNSEICKKDWEKTYNIKTLEYGPSHEDLITDLKELHQLVKQFRSTYI